MSPVRVKSAPVAVADAALAAGAAVAVVATAVAAAAVAVGNVIDLRTSLSAEMRRNCGSASSTFRLLLFLPVFHGASAVVTHWHWRLLLLLPV